MTAKSIAEIVREKSLETIGALPAGLLAMFATYSIVLVAQELGPLIPKSFSIKALWSLLGLSISANLLLAAWRFLTRRRKDELQLIYGILWDGKKNPHCPICKNGGLQHGLWRSQTTPSYYCHGCEKNFHLQDNVGNRKSIEETLAALDS